MFKTLKKLSLFVGLAFALSTNAQCQTILSEQEALRGLEAVYVVVENLDEDERQDGLSRRLPAKNQREFRFAKRQSIAVERAGNVTSATRDEPDGRPELLAHIQNTSRPLFDGT